MNPSTPKHTDEAHNVLREHIESVAPGASGSLSREVLGQSAEEFQATIALLRDLERAGVLRLGSMTQTDAVEFERLA